MNFSTLFSLQTALGIAVGYGWFLVPGLLVQRLGANRRECSACVLFAPLLGLATFGPVSVLVFNLVPFQWPWLIATYVCFNAVLFWSGNPGVVRPGRDVGWVHLACAAIGVIPCLSIYPFVYDGALYTGPAIHDHARVAFIDAIHRHGLPPVNAIFSPGQDVVFNYYYLWLFAAAQLRALTGIAGWPADVALTWLTFTAVTSALAGIARELGRSRAASWSVVVLAIGGPLVNAMPWLRALGWQPRNGLATAVGQAAWSPHHVLAAGAIVLAVYAFASAAESGERSWACAFVLGCLLGTVFGCSVWLAMALVVSAPFLLLAWVWCHRERIGALRDGAILLLRAAAVAIVACVPVLICAIAGPFAHQGSPVAFDLYRVAPRSTPAWAQFGLYWLYAVPLAYGAAYALGIAGVARAWKRGPAPRFAVLSAAAIFGFLLVSQILRSIVMNNDLGWRAHTVSNLFLIVWSVVLIDAVVTRAIATRAWVVVPAALAVAAGLYAAPIALPGPPADEPADVRAERSRFLTQARAWEVVRRYAGPNDFVQSNPYAFNRLCPWPINLGYMLFADRRSVFAHPHWVRTYAHNLDELLPQFERIVSNAFSKRPDARVLRTLRDGFRVKVLLVDRADPVWASDAIERSNLYARAHDDPVFRVYVAK